MRKCIEIVDFSWQHFIEAIRDLLYEYKIIFMQK